MLVMTFWNVVWITRQAGLRWKRRQWQRCQKEKTVSKKRYEDYEEQDISCTLAALMSYAAMPLCFKAEPKYSYSVVRL